MWYREKICNRLFHCIKSCNPQNNKCKHIYIYILNLQYNQNLVAKDIIITNCSCFLFLQHCLIMMNLIYPTAEIKL